MQRYACLLLMNLLSLNLFAVELQFDYRYDSAQFFDAPERREALETAGRLMNRYVDDLEAIRPGGENTWSTFLPRPGASRVLLTDLPIEEDTIVIFVGGDDRLGSLLAGSFEIASTASGTSEFIESVKSRETSTEDFAPLVGSIGFNPDVSWFFGQDAGQLGPREFDFITVAMHELGHVLGFASSNAFNSHIESGKFIGPQAMAQGSATNPGLNVDQTAGHFAPNTQSTWNGGSQEALLARVVGAGKRRFPTALDRAVLRDIGWEEAQPGDANLDRIVDGSDFQLLENAGKYETGELAGWSDGDFNNDGVFTSLDLIESLVSERDEVISPVSVKFDAVEHGLSFRWEGELAALQVSAVRSSVVFEDLRGAFDIASDGEIFAFAPTGIEGPIRRDLIGEVTFPLQLHVSGVTLHGTRFSTSLTLVPEAALDFRLVGLLLIGWYRHLMTSWERRLLGKFAISQASCV